MTDPEPMGDIQTSLDCSEITMADVPQETITSTDHTWLRETQQDKMAETKTYLIRTDLLLYNITKEEISKATQYWKCTQDNIRIVKSRTSELTHRYATLKLTDINPDLVEVPTHKRTILIRDKTYRYRIIKTLNKTETGTRMHPHQ